MEWHQKSIEEVLKELGTDPEAGLTSMDAASRLKDCGPNTLVEAKKEARLLKFVKQFTELIILVLIGSAVVAGLLGEWVDSLAIMAIVLLNGVIGFLQEEKAERVLETLKKLAAPTAKAIRDGRLETVPSSGLVPGDVVVLEAGDNVPADLRIMDAMYLKTQEAALTGESHPVDKVAEALEDSIPVADRTNMAYLGTNVVYGRGKAVVTGTGMNTEMGKIAKLLQEVKIEPTPLQKKLSEFARFLVYIAGAVVVLIFAIGIMRGEDVLEMFLTAVSLAVAAVPEGLPAVVTVVLALGVQRMVRRHALVRKLPSVETLGAATIVASDKTGTLTQNQMTVKKVFLAGGELVSVSGTGYAPEGAFYLDGKEVSPGGLPPLERLIEAGLLCNTAELRKTEDRWEVIGDPTEGALLSLGGKAGLSREGLGKRYRFVSEIPFDATRKMMTSVHKGPEGYYAFVKGAVEKVLPLCTKILDGKEARALTDDDRTRILKANNRFSEEALRVLALAARAEQQPLDTRSVHLLERDLTFLGLAGMIDPPREEVFTAVEKAKASGMTPIMITGDHKLTAVAIAKEIGVFHHGDMAITGDEFDSLNEDEFEKLLPRIKVYARVNPEHKLRVVKAWKKRGEVIAMTGDGVNDAPALREADIGVAMGITGTDVTKEASDMVLTDDNFASIISAVEEGRGIFDNIRKVVHYLLSCNMGEIMVLLVASLGGMPLPLLPVQILWMNLVTDGLPALGLAMEPVDPGVMDRPPRGKGEGIVTRTLLRVMALQGAFMAAVTLGVYAFELYYLDSSVEKARTMAFMVLVFSQMFHVFNCRNMWRSVFKLGVFTNRSLNIAVLVILAGQLLLSYTPALQPIFKVVRLTPGDWALVFAASVQPLVLMEIVKGVRGRRRLTAGRRGDT